MHNSLARHSAPLLTVGLVLVAAAIVSGCGGAKKTSGPPASTIPGMTFTAAVDKLVADGYPQKQSAYLNSLGSSAIGFRIAGSDAEKQAAQHVADELTAMGLSNVRLEPVPVDAWDFKGASVTVGARKMTASSFAGSGGTPSGGISGKIVYVGSGSLPEFKQAGSVKGKIVLIDTNLENIWLNLPCGEATLQGATAVVMTYGPTSAPWYQMTPDALGGNDAEYEKSFVPVVYVSRRDGDWLKQRIKAGAVDAVVNSDIALTMASDGGVAYNVVGELPGSSGDGTTVVIGGHTDAHFRPGADDTGAVSATLTMAKAMTMSGYKPKRTITFFFDTAEEYGYTDCYFDWIIGAWYAVTNAHPDWAGKAVGYINLESMAEKGARLGLQAPAELVPWLKTTATASASGLKRGVAVSGRVSSWSNGWTFTAAGIPTVTLAAVRPDYWKRYHTNVEVDANIDWQMIGGIIKYTAQLQAGFDQPTPPYSLGARAKELLASIDVKQLAAAGADPAKAKRVLAAATAYDKAASAYDQRALSMTAEQRSADFAGLMAVEKQFCNGMLALSVWEEEIFPHQQVAYDAGMLRATIAAAKAGDTAKALGSLVEVSATWNATAFSNEVYAQDIGRWAPDYPKLTWGAQSHLPPMPNVWPQYLLIQSGRFKEAIAQLNPVLVSETAELDKRLDEMSTLLEALTPQVTALQ
jgi:Iap family predicted aminopeptidase